MKAIILSAGRGNRLLPMTERLPKCAISVGNRALIDWQIDGLAANGIDQVIVVTGFGAGHVQRLLALPECRVQARTLYNPRFETADNLVSCWMARDEMDDDFVLLNGDTVFEPAVLGRLLAAPHRPVVMAIDHKDHYDDDDMKVRLQGKRLLRVGKDLPVEQVHGESIGMMVFRADGPGLFREALNRAMQEPRATSRWYLSVLDEMAASGRVWTQSIRGLDWAEIDYPMDLIRAASMVDAWGRGGVDRHARGTLGSVRC
jgi:choline kinase